MTEHYIGNIELPNLSEASPSTDKAAEEIDVLGLDDPLVVEHTPSLESVDISGSLHKSLHSDAIPVEEQSENLQALLHRTVGENAFNSVNWTGWLSIEGVETPQQPDSPTLINYSITSRYFPNGEYQSGNEVVNHSLSNGFGLTEPGTFALPTFVENVRVRNPVTEDYHTLNPTATKSTEDGDIDIYSIFGPWNTTNADYAQNPTFAIDASELQVSSLGDGESIYYDSFNIPKGEYKIVTRARDENQVQGSLRFHVLQITNSITYLDETHTTTTSDMEEVKSSEFEIDTNDEFRFEVSGNSSSTTLEVDHLFLEPQYTPEVMFDVPVAVDLSNEDGVNISGDSFTAGDRIAPVKVYDDTGSSDESQWVRIHGVEHDFDGNVVIENSSIRVRFANETELYWYDGSWNYIGNITVNEPNISESSLGVDGVNTISRDGVSVLFNSGLGWHECRLSRGDGYIQLSVADDSAVSLDTSPGVVDIDAAFTASELFYNSVEDDSLGTVDINDSDPTDNYLTTYDSSLEASMFVSGTDISSLDLSESTGTLTLDTPANSSPDVIVGATNASSTNVKSPVPNSHSAVAGSDIPLGTYVAISRASFSDTADEWTLDVENVTDSSQVDIDGYGVSKSISESTSQTYYVRYFRVTSEDFDDTIELSWTQSSGTGKITIDSFNLLPISLSDGVGPQDESYSAISETRINPFVAER